MDTASLLNITGYLRGFLEFVSDFTVLMSMGGLQKTSALSKKCLQKQHMEQSFSN